MMLPPLTVSLTGPMPGPMPLPNDAELPGDKGGKASKGSGEPLFSRLLQEKRGEMDQGGKAEKKAVAAEKGTQAAFSQSRQGVAEAVPAQECQGGHEAGAMLSADQRLPLRQWESGNAVTPSTDEVQGTGGSAAGEAIDAQGAPQQLAATARQKGLTPQDLAPLRSGSGLQAVAGSEAVKPAGEMSGGNVPKTDGQGLPAAAAEKFAPEMAGSGRQDRPVKRSPIPDLTGQKSVAEGPVGDAEPLVSGKNSGPVESLPAAVPAAGQRPVTEGLTVAAEPLVSGKHPGLVESTPAVVPAAEQRPVAAGLIVDAEPLVSGKHPGTIEPTPAAVPVAGQRPVAAGLGVDASALVSGKNSAPADSLPAAASARPSADRHGVSGAGADRTVSRLDKEALPGRAAEVLGGETVRSQATQDDRQPLDAHRPGGDQGKPAAASHSGQTGSGNQPDRPFMNPADHPALGAGMAKVGGEETPVHADVSRGALNPPTPLQGRREEWTLGEPRPLSGSGSEPVREKGSFALEHRTTDMTKENRVRENRPMDLPVDRGRASDQPAADGQAVRAAQGMVNVTRAMAAGRPETAPIALQGKDAASPSTATAPKGSAMARRDGEAVQAEPFRAEVTVPQRAFMAARGEPVKPPLRSDSPIFPLDSDRAVGRLAGPGSGDQDSLGGSLRAAGDSTPVPAKTAGPLPAFAGARAQAVLDQIFALRQQISSEGGRIKVTLSPAELGDVDLEIVVRRHKVEVVMIAERSDVQQLLQSRGEEIKSALVRQDMKVESFQVLLQDRGEGSQQHSAAWTAMDEHRRGREKGGTKQEQERDIDPVREEQNPQGHRGSVSIFA